ncbi:uncharacterized protein L199_008707 [Kwoniella botswanensis]|uniref:uncharacterized protein n=1 Tax=Kwoniella botswanensis TaxID=1268659 RepID=UPI00315CD6FD
MPRGKTTNPSGRCNRCAGILYVDLVEHFKKRHKGDRFTKDDISDTEVVLLSSSKGRSISQQLIDTCPFDSISLLSSSKGSSISQQLIDTCPSIASLLEASPWRSTLKTPSRFSSPLSSAHSASGHVPPANSTSSPLSSVVGTPSLSPASTRRSSQSLSPNGLSINHLQINSSPLTPTRRSSSRVTNPVLYVYDEADDDVFSHGQETEVYEEDGAGKEVEEDDDDEEEEEEEEEEIEDEAYWERKRAKEIEDAAQDGDDRPWSDEENEEERSVMSDDGSYQWQPEEDESDQGGWI